MAESKIFELNGIDVQQVAEGVESFLRDEKKMEVQCAAYEDGYYIQAGQSDTLRTLSGMKLATTVQLSVIDDNLNVTIGEGQWTDKLGAGAVGMFFAWPLAVTAGIGAYKQKKLPEEIFNVVARLTASQGYKAQPANPYAGRASMNNPYASQTRPNPYAAPGPAYQCPNCHAPLTRGAKFCANCGTKVVSTCPDCGATVAPGSKFCPQCGKDLL